MKEQSSATVSRATWFVGASYGGTEDQSARFLKNGIWEVDQPTDKEVALVKSMSVGDRIAIKAAYVRKRGLPFDNHDEPVSVMAIKAIGTVTGNPQDGERVTVSWTPVVPAREWYFFTYRATMWRVLPGEWMTDALIAFAFDGKAQDIDRFRNAPFWQERFGTVAPEKERFAWTKFYEAVATKLLTYQNNRAALIKGLREMSGRVEGLNHLQDQFADGTSGFMKDICPFTTMGIFNRGLTAANRTIVATELGKFLGVEQKAPTAFDGVPLLNLQNSWYFPFEKNREPDHIESLWTVFAAAIKYADADNDDARKEFAEAFDNANGRQGTAWNLTFGLYWARPWAFLSLDRNSQVFINKKLSLPIGLHGPKKRCNANDYLSLMDVLEPRFKEASYPVHSFPELSLEAWRYEDPTETKSDGEGEGLAGGIDTEIGLGDGGQEAAKSPAPIVPYSVDDILKDGCFLERGELERLLERLRTKKNLILQGPPGTGKTWLAKRVAFALMGQRDEGKVRAVQFHPNLSYEDFVRGWRPTGEGKLTLMDGVFMEAIKAASKNASTYVCCDRGDQ